MAGKNKENISAWSLLVPIILLGIAVAVTSDILEAADIEDRETVSVTPRPNKDAEDPIHEGTCGADDSKCPSQIEKNEELNRLKQENEIYRRALAWIDERQKLFTDKFINHSFASDKESIIKWLKDVRNAFYKKFNFGQEE